MGFRDKTMKHEKLCGSTLDLAELVLEYDKNGKPKLDIKGVPEETSWNRVTTGMKEWVFYLFKFWAIIAASILIIGISHEAITKVIGNNETIIKFMNKLIDTSTFIITFLILLIISFTLGLLHLNKKFDNRFRKFFTVKTGVGEKTKATFSEFKSKEFVLYNISNVYLEFEASKDVSTQLKKVWIKKGPVSSVYESQANVKGLVWKGDDKDPIWNAHFYFKRVPKNGELYLEWI